MDKKYELLLNDTIEYKGKILYRIKALKNFGHIYKDVIGGYIESEKNLSHSGECWIYNKAKVYDNAEVSGNSKVYGAAEVYEKAEVYGNAGICGDAKVYGNSKVCGYAVVSGSVVINKGTIIGDVSMPFKDIFQYQCKNRFLTGILTENDEILYTIGYQENITEEEFLDSIYNEDGGLEENPHRKEYLKLTSLIKMYFKGE